MTLISLVKDKDPAKALRDAVELAGGLDVKGDVLIKPNLSCARPSRSGLVTNVDLVKAAVELVAEAGARPIVGDLPILGWSPEEVYRKTGIAAIEKAGGELASLDSFVEIVLPDAKVLKMVSISRQAIQADHIINMPVLKHHFFTHISGCMKNLFGLVEPGFRPKVHVLGLDEPLVDLYEFLRPKIALNIMDATYVAQSVRPAGPYYGPTESKSAVNVGMVMVSRDAVALDSMAAKVVRINPKDIEMVRIASERGLGSLDTRTIGNARGSTVKIKKSLAGKLLPYMEEVWTNEKLNKVSHPFAKRIYGKDVVSLKEARSHMDHAGPSCITLAGKCRACGLCAEACPMKNITLREQGPQLGQKCIKCYICVEICPAGALAIERK